MYENALEFQIVIKKQEVNQFTSKLKLKGISLESLFWKKKKVMKGNICLGL